ncbi:hypothetical protein KIPB_006665 [Kipferlia bialata]|uniref:Uncharacterized protein n=1 Tax=Kipferlia bialata TaxID=797122 RepID=A0A9K3CYW5_9EUKA|nr:hypothetical protein KIPB_006665 [Kipferlia bialata]|eukprot:g6665.t1
MPVPTLAFTRPKKDYKRPYEFFSVDAQDYHVEIRHFTDVHYALRAKVIDQAVQVTAESCTADSQTPYARTRHNVTQHDPPLLRESDVQKTLGDPEFGAFLSNASSIMMEAIEANRLADPVKVQQNGIIY